ncbi:hypothetical protein [Rheinheimera baltica]|uniref:hypothetical protein n=1 Tax=Rheinheimera baltica TaxID=67576 RepID=UPI000425E297|nr:hypothetical protein [Rheinheimera baltica]
MFDFLKKIDLDKVVQPDLFALKNTDKHLLPQVIDRWHKEVFYSHIDFKNTSETCEFLFFRSLVREDYELLENDIASSVNDSNCVFFSNYKTNLKGLNLDIVRLITQCREIVYLINEKDPLIRNGLYLRVVWYVYVLQKISEMEFKVFVAFADMQPIENLIVQMLHLLKPDVQTVTLQHGLYIDYSGYETVNEVNYKNHVAKHFLAWGIETKELINKYHKDSSIFICGKPSIAGLPSVSEFQTRNNAKTDILIVTDQKIFQAQNEELADIVAIVAEKLGLNVYIRFHPSNNKNIILNKHPNFKELKRINRRYIVIGHTSSLLYEAHTLGYSTFRIKSNVHHIQFPSNLEFESCEELIFKITNFNEPKLSDSVRYISFVGSASVFEYRNALNTILSLAINSKDI